MLSMSARTISVFLAVSVVMSSGRISAVMIKKNQSGLGLAKRKLYMAKQVRKSGENTCKKGEHKGFDELMKKFSVMISAHEDAIGDAQDEVLRKKWKISYDTVTTTLAASTQILAKIHNEVRHHLRKKTCQRKTKNLVFTFSKTKTNLDEFDLYVKLQTTLNIKNKKYKSIRKYKSYLIKYCPRQSKPQSKRTLILINCLKKLTPELEESLPANLQFMIFRQIINKYLAEY